MDREAAQARLNRIRSFNSELAALEQAGIDQRTNASAAPVVSGVISPVTTVLIAPARLRDLLLKFGPSDWMLAKAPGYTIDVAVGRRYEPSILAIDPIDSAAPPH